MIELDTKFNQYGMSTVILVEKLTNKHLHNELANNNTDHERNILEIG